MTEPNETTDQQNLNADSSANEDQIKTPATEESVEPKESLLDKAKEEVKEIIDDVKEGFETAKDKVEEIFEKAKDAIEGTPATEDQTKQSEAPASGAEDLTALKTASDPAHDSIGANGGTITDLGDGLSDKAADALNDDSETKNTPAETADLSDEEKGLDDASVDTEEAKPVFNNEGEAPIQSGAASLGDRPRGGYTGPTASGEPEATK